MASSVRFGHDVVVTGSLISIGSTVAAAYHLPWLWVGIISLVLLVSRIQYAIWLVAIGIAIILLTHLRGITTERVGDPMPELRRTILAPLVSNIGGDAGALAAGLTLGDSSYFSSVFRSALQKTNTTHIVALSGFNVILLISMLRYAVRDRMTRKKELGLCIGLLGVIIGIVGIQPSLIRAALMASIALLLSYHGKRIPRGKLLLVTAAGMLLIYPSWIRDLGFQLSFISTWALLISVGDMEAWVTQSTPKIQWLGQIIIPTFVAQIAVTPLLLAIIGTTGLIGFVVNPLISPLTPLLTVTAGGYLILTHLTRGIGSSMASLVELVLSIPIAIITIAANVPLAVQIGIPLSVVISMYLCSLIWAFRYKPELW